MYFASVVDELAFVVKAVFGEPSDFLGVCCVESYGVGGVILLGHGFQVTVARSRRLHSLLHHITTCGNHPEIPDGSARHSIEGD
jgi:hypothetical protein